MQSLLLQSANNPLRDFHGRSRSATEQAERKSALADRITKALGILSSADWAQTVIISIVLGFGARFALAGLDAILHN